jgi:hypothetical protein
VTLGAAFDSLTLRDVCFAISNAEFGWLIIEMYSQENIAPMLAGFDSSEKNVWSGPR